MAGQTPDLRYGRGTRVWATTINGVVERVVWEDVGDAVLVCSPQQFDALRKGHDAAMPIGFPKAAISVVTDDQDQEG